jgi:hypothetical protein
MQTDVCITLRGNSFFNREKTVSKLAEGVIEFVPDKDIPNVSSLVGLNIDWNYYGDGAWDTYTITEAEII